ncbi:MAG: M3 family oligoendopeptidase, partial [Cyclobacteriaceae bacterium]
MSAQLTIPERPKRKFLPEEFKISSWDLLKPFFDKLLDRQIHSSEELEQWLSDRSELESVVSEDMGWRYIRMTCFTENEEHRKAYQDFVENIQPHMSPLSDALNNKVIDSPYLK